MLHTERIHEQVGVIRSGVGEFCDLKRTPERRLSGILAITNEAPSSAIGGMTSRQIGQGILDELSGNPRYNFDQQAMTAGSFATIAMAIEADDPYPMGEYIEAFTRFGSTPRSITKRVVEGVIYDPKLSADERDQLYDLAKEVGMLHFSIRLMHGLSRRIRGSGDR